MGLRATVLLSVYFGLSSIGAFGAPLTPDHHGRSLTNSLKRSGYSTLVAAIEAAGMSAELSGNRSLTLLAPTNRAFEKLPRGVLQALLRSENAPQLRALLSAHLIKGRKDLRTLVANETRSTSAGNTLRFSLANGRVSINLKGEVVQADVGARKSIFHGVSEVLVPKGFTLPGAQPRHPRVDQKRRAAALKTLRNIGSAGKSATPSLVKIILDRSDPLRADAMKTIRALGSGASGAAKALGAIAKDASDPLATEALRTLQSLGSGARAAVPALTEIINLRATVHTKAARPKVLKITADWANHVSKRGLEADVIEVRAKSGGSIRLRDCKADRIVVRGSGGASITLSGSTGSLEVDVSGGVTLNARNLKADRLKGSFSGGSRSTVNAQSNLVVDISGSSRVSYVETGAKISRRVSRYSKLSPVDHRARAKATTVHH